MRVSVIDGSTPITFETLKDRSRVSSEKLESTLWLLWNFQNTDPAGFKHFARNLTSRQITVDDSLKRAKLTSENGEIEAEAGTIIDNAVTSEGRLIDPREGSPDTAFQHRASTERLRFGEYISRPFLIWTMDNLTRAIFQNPEAIKELSIACRKSDFPLSMKHSAILQNYGLIDENGNVDVNSKRVVEYAINQQQIQITNPLWQGNSEPCANF